MARFITGVRFMAGPMAGACGMPFFRFLGWNVLGAIVWCSLVVPSATWSATSYIPRSDDASGLAMDGLAAFVVLLVVFVFWWRNRPCCRVASSIVAAAASR